MKKKSFAHLLILALVMVIIVPAVVFAGSWPDTGQTKCYDNTQVLPCPQPGEPFYGQDANYTSNPHSYTDLGNGVIQDNVTGLMWQKDKAPTGDWYEANTYCENLILGEYSDWRLPTVKELSTLVDSGRWAPTIDTTYFPNITMSNHWTSTPRANNADSVWLVNFYYGYVSNVGKTVTYHVKAVRGGQAWAFDNSFIDNGDGTVTDTNSGLMWQQVTAPGTYNWQQALAYCENLSLAEKSDWRLPDRNELLSLVDYTRYFPAIDITFFPDTQGAYWSSTPNDYNLTSAWHIGFDAGSIFYSNRSTFEYVRAVRDVPCRVVGDSDLDGVCNDVDNCPTTANGPTLGTCMPGSDKAGTTCNSDADCVIGCSTNGTCSKNQEDTDLEGVGDVCDNCITTPNPKQLNNDNDAFGNACDDDDDNDGILDGEDNCPNVPNPDQADSDGDKIGNACDC